MFTFVPFKLVSLYKTDTGITYIRWGKKTCSEAANLVYSGI
jgi:hypothetical protein